MSSRPNQKSLKRSIKSPLPRLLVVAAIAISIAILVVAGSITASAATQSDGLNTHSMYPELSLLQPKQPSKIPSVVQYRIKAIEAALEAAGPERLLSSQAVSELSDDLLRVTEKGAIDLEFHSANAVGSPEESELMALGATILISTADLNWPESSSNGRC